jgi:hypothetical protein
MFPRASEWCYSDDPLKRARGADVLCQLRRPRVSKENAAGHDSDPVFVSESFELISRMLARECNETALMSQLYALGHLYKIEAVPLLVAFATDAREDMRYAVAHSLGHFPHDPLSIVTLIQLADDADDDVRNWSLFALGSQSDSDSPTLRNLFAAHLEDSNEDARQEAIAGLAKRRDRRAALPLLRLMESGSYYAHNYYDFLNLVVDEADRSGWGTEDFIDALYERYADILPAREQSAALGTAPADERTGLVE